MAEGLGDHGIAHPDWIVQDDRFLLDEAQGGRDRGSATERPGAVGEVDSSMEHMVSKWASRTRFVMPAASRPESSPSQSGWRSSIWPRSYRGGLGQPSPDGVERPVESYGAQHRFELTGLGHPATSCSPKRGDRVTADTCAGRGGSLSVDITQSLPSESLFHSFQDEPTSCRASFVSADLSVRPKSSRHAEPKLTPCG